MIIETIRQVKMFGSLGTGHHNHHVSTRQMSAETLEEEDKVTQRGETGDNIQKMEQGSVTCNVLSRRVGFIV